MIKPGKLIPKQQLRKLQTYIRDYRYINTSIYIMLLYNNNSRQYHIDRLATSAAYSRMFRLIYRFTKKSIFFRNE